MEFIIDIWFKINLTGIAIGIALFALAVMARVANEKSYKEFFIDKFGSVMSLDIISWFIYLIVWGVWI